MLLDIIQHLEKVGKRQPSFLIMAEHILQCENPFILETGCMRTDDNYEGDGMSTLLWNNLLRLMKKGKCISIDINEEAIAFAHKKMGVLQQCDLVCSDSVKHLSRMARYWNDSKIDLLYLDSLDMEFPDPVPAFTHTLFEFLTVKQFLSPNALIVVDDNINVIKDNEPEERFVSKGEYIRQYFETIGNPPIYDGYQLVWRNRV